MRQKFEKWLIENFDELVIYDEIKKKYKFMSPNKPLIIEWVLEAFKEIDANMVRKSKLFY